MCALLGVQASQLSSVKPHARNLEASVVHVSNEKSHISGVTWPMSICVEARVRGEFIRTQIDRSQSRLCARRLAALVGNW